MGIDGTPLMDDSIIKDLVKTAKKAVQDNQNQEIMNIFDKMPELKQESENMMGLTIEKEVKMPEKSEVPVKTPEINEQVKTDKLKNTSKIDKNDPELLKNAPKPEFIVAGEEKKASIVVNLSENRLYRYTDEGEPFEVYSIASGKKTTPTATGIRKVSHIETYPYKNAPKSTKRYKNPKDYGPNILILNIIDPETGKSKGSNGEFIHGNNNPSSIGKYASHGCMRMDNTVIKQLAKEVKPGSYVIIQ